MSVSRRGRRHGWEREGWKERQEREKKREKERQTGMGEKKIEREERERERDRQRDRGGRDREREREREKRERERDRGEREKITNIKKIIQFYLVVLHSAERSEARQVSCYNPLSFFNPVTGDKVGKKMIERETGWERERKI